MKFKTIKMYAIIITLFLLSSCSNQDLQSLSEEQLFTFIDFYISGEFTPNYDNVLSKVSEYCNKSVLLPIIARRSRNVEEYEGDLKVEITKCVYSRDGNTEKYTIVGKNMYWVFYMSIHYDDDEKMITDAGVTYYVP